MKYRKIPVIIEALQWNGTIDSIADFLPVQTNTDKKVYSPFFILENELYIETLENDKNNKFHVSKGDFIIKGVKGEFYACKPDIFKMTYEEVNG